MHGSYIGNNKMLIRPLWGGKMVASSEDLSLMPDLMIDGCFDIALTNFIRANIKQGMTVVDVGANIGYISVLLGYMVGETGKVISYEASPKVFEFLMENMKMNYHRHAEVHPLAVFSRDTTLIFHEPTRFQGNGSIKGNVQDSFRVNAPFDSLDKIMVDAVALDNHLKDIEFIDFMKMDIEGGEYQAFLGMEKIIKDGRLGVVSYEFNRQLDEDLLPMKELMKFYLNRHNARFYTIIGDGRLVPDDIDSMFDRVHIDNIVVTFN